jgi:hypothetical protein
MYIREIKGNWLRHPFWRKSFKLDDQKDLDKLLNCSVGEIWIDTNKGLNVAADEKVSEFLNSDADKVSIERIEDPFEWQLDVNKIQGYKGI